MRQKTLLIAKALRKDLSDSSLVNYIKENQRIVENETLMGRKPGKYLIYLNAGYIALTMKVVVK